jgi:ABC-type branched-subunit amino acid transport system substrate-binding protein
MKIKGVFQQRLILVFLALVLAVSTLVVACGKGKEATPTPTPTITPTATVAPTTPAPTPTAVPATPTPTAAPATPTPSPTSQKPVKIGGLSAWTGPGAISGNSLATPDISVVEDQVKQMGGILGGRLIEVVKGDTASTTEGAVSAALKLALQPDIPILVWGGVTGADCMAVGDVAKEKKIPYITFSPAPPNFFADTIYTACTAWTAESAMGKVADFLAKVIKPKKATFLGQDSSVVHEYMDALKPLLKDQGVDLVYEQYHDPSTTDMTPYLTKIKYYNPDVALFDETAEGQMNINSQIMDLGGWESIKPFSISTAGSGAGAIKMAGAVGMYVWVSWIPGLDTPGGKAFEEAFKNKLGKLPSANDSPFYTAIWAAINAIKMAGSDNRDQIAQTIRSGKLSWDAPMGRLTFTTNGEVNIEGFIAQVVEKNKLVEVKY